MKTLQDSNKAKGMVRIIKTDSKTGKVKLDTGWMPNLVMSGTNTGIALILKQLGALFLAPANTCQINYFGIGTSATAPATSDTQLGAETARQPLSLATLSTNVLTLQSFFADASLSNGTYYEAGMFVDGTASANSGQIFAHALFGTPYVKASGEDTTLQWSYTLN